MAHGIGEGNIFSLDHLLRLSCEKQRSSVIGIQRVFSYLWQKKLLCFPNKQFSTACKILHSNIPVGTLLIWTANENNIGRNNKRYVCFAGLLNILSEETGDILSG